MASSKRHKWTTFETNALVHILASHKYAGDRDQMALPTALNDSLHKYDHDADIPWEDVQWKAQRIIERRPVFNELMMRAKVPKITRLLMRSFERGLRSTGHKKDISRNGNEAGADSAVHPSRMEQVHGRDRHGEVNGTSVEMDLGDVWGGAGTNPGRVDAAVAAAPATSTEADWGTGWGGDRDVQGTGDAAASTSQGADLGKDWGSGDTTEASGNATEDTTKEPIDWFKKAGLDTLMRPTNFPGSRPAGNIGESWTLSDEAWASYWAHVGGVPENNGNTIPTYGQQTGTIMDADDEDEVGWGGVETGYEGSATSPRFTPMHRPY
ncbi:MAG: hypothetical protein M1816_002752 [Peltula sp. TS41687]|nr:MAG: hypothetical protein M1816_002752 [Peltula sp. TS41687]